MYLLYSVLIVVLFFVASPYFLYQVVRHRKYVSSFRQRLGYLPASFNPERRESVWIHAVSVGEVMAARALLGELRQRHPELRLVLSTTTLTGQFVARQDMPDLDVFYFPFDLPWIINRTLEAVRPRLLILMETELWPNILQSCRLRGIRTCVVNGRISPRSFPRYRLVRSLFRRVLDNVDCFCMQDEASASRLIELGAKPSRVKVTGSLKFDAVQAPELEASAAIRDRVLRYFRVPADRPVLVAASTRRGEELPVLQAFERVKRSTSSALLIMAPRHPERFSEVAQLAERAGFEVARRSELTIDAEPRADVVILDSIGELARVYRVATIVFVGGSLVNWGGHNILEPAVFGKAIVFGPYMQNFEAIAEAFLRHDAACQVRHAAELEEVLLGLLTDPVRRASLGAAAKALVEANRGALQKSVVEVEAILGVDGGRAQGLTGSLRRVH